MKKLIMLSIAAVALAAWSARAGDAKALYEQTCLKCHGADGKGDTKMGQKLGVKDYSSAAVQDAMKDADAIKAIKEGVKDKIGSCKVPTAFALFPKDISHPPREWAERFFQVERWTDMPRGGHFAAMEEPQLLAEDLRTWFRNFR